MPNIRVADFVYKVSEISEGGLRIRCRNAHFRTGEEFTGVITFSDGETLEVTGTVLRRDYVDYVIAPLEGVTFRHVLMEQQRFMRAFPRTRTEAN